MVKSTVKNASPQLPANAQLRGKLGGKEGRGELVLPTWEHLAGGRNTFTFAHKHVLTCRQHTTESTSTSVSGQQWAKGGTPSGTQTLSVERMDTRSRFWWTGSASLGGFLRGPSSVHWTHPACENTPGNCASLTAEWCSPRRLCSTKCSCSPLPGSGHAHKH